MARDQQIELELQRIEAKHGILRARDVVAEASNKASALHDYFTWDNNRAAARWRLVEARRLIKTSVYFIPMKMKVIRTRVFWSLSPDRTVDGGGYRPTETVLTTPLLRNQMLHDALRELQSFQHKYQSLTELTDVFAAISKVATPPEPQPPRSDHRKKLAKRGQPSRPPSGGKRTALQTR